MMQVKILPTKMGKFKNTFSLKINKKLTLMIFLKI